MSVSRQEISTIEENITKKKVGVASSQKQAQKLLKEVAKGEKENAKVAGELEQKEADLKVSCHKRNQLRVNMIPSSTVV